MSLTVDYINSYKPSWDRPLKVINSLNETILIISPVVNEEFAIYFIDIGFDYRDTDDLSEYSLAPKDPTRLYQFAYKNDYGVWALGFHMVDERGYNGQSEKLDDLYDEWKILEGCYIDVEID